MRRLVGGLALFSAAAAVNPAAAMTVGDAVQQFVAPMVQSVNLPAGVSVGVYHHGQIQYFAYGVRDERMRPVNEMTIFEIGSCTKTFTAALLGEAVDAGRITLNQSIAPLMPMGFTLQPGAQTVTPLELADFTSDLPDDPPGLPDELRLRDIQHYTVRDFLGFISGWSPSVPLPAPYKYSNTGVGLLGLLLAGSVEDWERMVRERIIEPLAMRDTFVRPSDDQRSRMAHGFRKDGGPAPEWPVFAWAAAGALRSNAHDLVTYLGANLGHAQVNDGNAPPELLAGMSMTHQTYHQIDPGRPFYQAMTWRVRRAGEGEEIVFKDGGTDGFSSFIGFNPAKDLAVVILANWNGAEVVAAGLDVIGHVSDAQ